MTDSLEAFVQKLDENSNADSVKTKSGKTILILKSIEESIKEQVRQPGDGSVFAKAWKVEELKPSLENINPNQNTSIYEGKLHGAGFDLIAERKDVVPLKKLVGYSEEKKLVESESRRVAHIPQEINKFRTDTVTYELRPVDLEEAIKDFTEFEKDAEEGRLFMLEDVKIGPHIERWSDDLYIVVPKN